MEPLKDERTEKLITKKPDSALMDIIVVFDLCRNV